MGFGAAFGGGFGPVLDRGGAVAVGNGLLNNLIAYWGLDEEGGANNALDKHTNALTLTQASSPGSDTGKVYAGARTFDGSADYFTRDSETLLQTGNVDQTFAIWAYLTDKTDDRCLLGKYTGTTNKAEYVVRYQQSSNRFRAVLGTGSAAAAAVNAATFGAPSLNTWYLVIVWYDATAGNIYISVNDGTADSAAKTATPGVGSETFNIGMYSNLGFMHGRLGPVAMWKSVAGGGGVLSAAQRSALYASGNGLAYASFTT